MGFLRSQQDRDGGFPAQGSGDSNAQSTSWAVQGLIAAGVDAIITDDPAELIGYMKKRGLR